MGSENHEDSSKPVEKYTGMAGLLDLSDDVLLIILRSCSPQDLKSLGFTCARLGALVLDRSLWSSVDARQIPLGRHRMRWLIERALGAHTRTLKLRGYADQADGCLGYMNTYSHRESKDENGSSISSMGSEERYLCGGPRIYRLTQTLPSVVRYGGSPVSAPSSCPGPQLTLTHTALREMSLRCPNLTTLELDYCVIDCRTTNLGMFPKSLKKLSLRGTKCFNLEARSFLFKIQDHLVDLEELDVSNCNWIEPACMLPLSKIPKLRSLWMRECYKLAEFVAYASLATRYGFKELKFLDLRGSPVGDSEVSAVGWLGVLEELLLAPAPDSVRTTDHAHYSQDPLPPHKELEEWEEKEPDYFTAPTIPEADWIRDEEDVRGNRSMYYSNCDDPTACILLERMVAEPVSPGEYSQVYHQFLSGHNSNVQLANPAQYRESYRRFMMRPTHGHPPAGYSLFIRRPDDDDQLMPGPAQRGAPGADDGHAGPSGVGEIMCSCGPWRTRPPGFEYSVGPSGSAGPSGSGAGPSGSAEPSGSGAGPSGSASPSRFGAGPSGSATGPSGSAAPTCSSVGSPGSGKALSILCSSGSVCGLSGSSEALGSAGPSDSGEAMVAAGSSDSLAGPSSSSESTSNTKPSGVPGPSGSGAGSSEDPSASGAGPSRFDKGPPGSIAGPLRTGKALSIPCPSGTDKVVSAAGSSDSPASPTSSGESTSDATTFGVPGLSGSGAGPSGSIGLSGFNDPSGTFSPSGFTASPSGSAGSSVTLDSAGPSGCANQSFVAGPSGSAGPSSSGSQSFVAGPLRSGSPSVVAGPSSSDGPSVFAVPSIPASPSGSNKNSKSHGSKDYDKLKKKRKRTDKISGEGKESRGPSGERKKSRKLKESDGPSDRPKKSRKLINSDGSPDKPKKPRKSESDGPSDEAKKSRKSKDADGSPDKPKKSHQSKDCDESPDKPKKSRKSNSDESDKSNKPHKKRSNGPKMPHTCNRSGSAGPSRKRGSDNDNPAAKRPCAETQTVELSDEQRFREFYESMRHPRRVFEITINEMNRRAREPESSDDSDDDDDANGDVCSDCENDPPKKEPEPAAGAEPAESVEPAAGSAIEPAAGSANEPAAGSANEPAAGNNPANPSPANSNSQTESTRVYQFRQYRRPIVIEEYINVADPDAPGVLPRGVLFPGSPTRLDHSALVSDSSIRRFGRAIGENINYIHIGGGVGAEGNARPDRSSIRFLSITGFRHVTDASLVHLSTAAPFLERIDFTGTSVTAAGVKRFREMRPEVEVIFSENVD